MYKNILVLMSAVLPTVGHQYLIEFAQNFSANLNSISENLEDIESRVYVGVSSRPEEKLSVYQKIHILRMSYDVNFFEIKGAYYDKPKEAPSEEIFWQSWKEILNDDREYHYVIASDLYGKKLAEVLDAEFIPCDIARDNFPVEGKYARINPVLWYDSIHPNLRMQMTENIVLFGQESTGKTTATRYLASDFSGCAESYEWARQYLENCGEDLTEKKMENILLSQIAQENAIISMKKGKVPFIFFDTDYLSTIGYYRILQRDFGGYDIPEFMYNLEHLIDKNRYYILMNDRIPFEKDILRYGGDFRQSDMKFWIDLLEEFGCSYYVVQETKFYARNEEISRHIEEYYNNKHKFVRY